MSIREKLLIRLDHLLCKVLSSLPLRLHQKLSQFYIKDFVANTSGKDCLLEASFLERLFENYVYDFERFSTWCSFKREASSKASLKAYLTKEYHRIEKRLAFKEPRVNFRPEIAQNLADKTELYIDNYGIDDTVKASIDCIRAYYDFNLKHKVDNKVLSEKIQKINSKVEVDSSLHLGGTLFFDKTEILEKSKIDLKSFFESRYSVRDFSSESVSRQLIKQAVEMAQKTPSVCNRQSSKVYAFDEESLKNAVLGQQNGNKGFGDKAKVVLVVTSDLRHFFSIGERYQAWIDGGMFSMSLIYALHSLGLGSCCLNWSVEKERDSKLRVVSEIPDYETVIMMIAVGHLPHNFKVAKSARKKIEDVLIIN